MNSINGPSKQLYANIHYSPSLLSKYSFASSPFSSQLHQTILITSHQLHQLNTIPTSNIYIAISSKHNGFYHLSTSQNTNNSQSVSLGQTIESTI